MAIGLALLAGASLVSGAMGASAAKKAAGAQARSAQQGIDETGRQFDITREDFAPYREVGTEGLYTLADYLGLGTGRGISGVGEAPVMPTQEQFTAAAIPGQYLGSRGDRGGGQAIWGPSTPGGFDDAGYNTAMEQYLADKAGYETGMGAARADPRYGSLLQPFTGESLATEPGYQFGLAEGEKAIDRSARGRGSFDSGATLKALLRYGQDYAGTKFNEGFNRDAASKSSIYNMLAGITGMGQTATGQVATAGTNASTNIANLLGQQGDARAAGIVGSNNAWSQAIGQGMQGYQNMNMLDWLKGINNPAAKTAMQVGFN